MSFLVKCFRRTAQAGSSLARGLISGTPSGGNCARHSRSMQHGVCLLRTSHRQFSARPMRKALILCRPRSAAYATRPSVPRSPSATAAVSHRTRVLSSIASLGRSRAVVRSSRLISPTVVPTLKRLNSSDGFSASNLQYAESLYAQYSEDPNSVDPSWQSFFTSGDFLQPTSTAIRTPTNIPRLASGSFDLNSVEAKKAVTDAVNLMNLARSFASYGHFNAKLDPLGILEQGIDRKQFVPELLSPSYWGFTTKEDCERPIYVGEHGQFLALMGLDDGWASVNQVVTRLNEVYCASIGHQYMHIANSTKNNFLRQMIERDRGVVDGVEKKRIMDRLLWADTFEKVFDKKYPAQKRFGLVGGESFVPLLKEIIDEGARQGIDEFVLGMPHRGRLITLCSVMRKPLERIFYEFRGRAAPDSDILEAGDVKYHLGYSSERKTPDEISVHLSLFPNPSHLEAVNPVVMGKVRAKQWYKKDNTRKRTCAILMHGDASFAGQGNVYESMSLTDLYDYTTGGVIHVIVNNQIGFTTDSFNARSSPYCTDVARSIAAPIWHVNGDDPEACVRCAKMAVRYRQNFASDTVLDLVCYRRYGHNEGDNPTFTHPYMYKVIEEKTKNKQTVTDQYKTKLINEGVMNQDEIDAMEQRITDIINECYDISETMSSSPPDWLDGNWSSVVGPHQDGKEYPTSITHDVAHAIGKAMVDLPEGFTIHRTLQGIMKKRFESIEKGTDIDWGTAEALAFGSLLYEGVHVRVSGQDSERGTFSHRHAVLHEQKNIDRDHRPTFVPLANLPGAKARFRISNSNLSELAVLGFEYGYSTEHPNQLVIWEAQFGDFANGGQVMFDQFVSSAEPKWLKQSGLVILLPHGYEGGGPEHSSGRMERFLQMCNDDEDEFNLDPIKQAQRINWQVLNCTTPANIFHAMRRQVKRNFRKPLVIFSPKTGLKHKYCTSKLSDFTDPDSGFQRVIPENWDHMPEAVKPVSNDKVRRLVFVSGKLWIHLMDERLKNGTEDAAKAKGVYDNVAIVRMEQISPFPYDLVSQELKKYPNAELVWAQEEPKNMGGWSYVQPRMVTAQQSSDQLRSIRCISRNPAASPATGYPSVDTAERKHIVDETFAV